MNELHFLRPNFFYLFIPLVLGLILFLTKKNRSCWDKICSKELLPYITVKKTKKNLLFAFLIFVLFSWLITAMAGPSWKQSFQPFFKPRDGLVIALDLSDAMNAEDIKPSRLKRAIYKINDILEQRKGSQTALLVFSANPFMVTPLTDDHATIQSQLTALDTSIMPSRGHSVVKALQKASELLNQAGVVNGSILLITSQLSDDDLTKSLGLIQKAKFKLSILAVGTENPTPILNPMGGFMKDAKGGILTTKLPVENLKKLAIGNGLYLDLKIDDSDVLLLAKEFNKQSNVNKDESTIGAKKWQDQGYLLVLFALPFISLLFRRGVLLILIFIPHICFGSLFESNDEKAEKLFCQEEYSKACPLFENPDWKACAHYKLEEYEVASKLFKENDSVDGLYNYGTARAKLGDFEEALKAYSKVLEINPEHEDALYNKKLIEEQKSKDEKPNQDNQDKKDTNKENDPNQSEQNKPDQENQKKSENQNKPEDKNNQNTQENEDKQNPDKDQQKNEDNEDNEQKDDLEESESNDQENEEPCETKEDAQKKMDERLLDRIKDDPGGLLRRKFLQQYRRQ